MVGGIELWNFFANGNRFGCSNLQVTSEIQKEPGAGIGNSLASSIHSNAMKADLSSCYLVFDFMQHV